MTTDPVEFTYLRAERSADALVVSCHLPQFVRQHRAKAATSADRLFRRNLARLGGTPSGAGFAVIPEKLHELGDIDRRISAIVEAPLSGQLVERALGITGEERRRWTRDGRLPTCGKSVGGRSGYLFSLPLYSLAVVQQLAEVEGVIGAWRSADQA